MKKYLKILMVGMVVTMPLQPFQSEATILDTIIVTAPRDPPGPLEPPGGGGVGGIDQGPSGGSGGDGASAKEAAEGVVDRYKPVCKKPQESNNEYSNKLLGDCVSTSVELAISENPIIGRTPLARGFLTTEVTKFCTIKVNDLVGSGQVKNC